MNSTQMRMLKKQVDESFAHLKQALDRRQKLIQRQIELTVQEEFSQLPAKAQEEFEAIIADADALMARVEKFETWLTKHNYVGVGGGKASSQYNRYVQVVALQRSNIHRNLRWMGTKVDTVIAQRTQEQEEAYNGAVFKIEQERLNLNQAILEDNVEDAAEVLARIPRLDQLLPAPEYITLPA